MGFVDKAIESIAISMALGFVACARPVAEPVDDQPGRETRLASERRAVPAELALPRPVGGQRKAAPDLTGAAVSDIEACGACHAEIAAQWSSSAHAFASFSNPVYRASVERLREEASLASSRMCAGCHDPALEVDGAMDRPIDPGDRRAHAGVACRICHGAGHTTPDGNGSYQLTRLVTGPSDASPSSIRAHAAQAMPEPVRSGAVCLSCHRSFLGPESGNPHHLSGMDDAADWARSAYANSHAARIDDGVGKKTCVGCHMRRTKASLPEPAATGGRVASHRFIGAHSWLAEMQGDPEQLARVRDRLRGSATVDIAAVHVDGDVHLAPEGSVAVASGATAVADVVIANERTGHRFPGGARDIHDTWLEVVVTDARGRPVARAGTEHAESGDDPSAHRLLAQLLDDEGRQLYQHETHHFRAKAFDNTVEPRGFSLVRYELRIPKDVADSRYPLELRVRLMHRSRTLAMQKLACDRARSGARFTRAAARYRGKALDPCRAQPLTLIGEAAIRLGRARAPRAPRQRAAPRWRRLYHHGLALLGGVQEHRQDARASFREALAELGDSANPRLRAGILLGLAELAAGQLRIDEASTWIERARALAPGHPAILRARGEALMQVWRFDEAILPLTRAARAAPRDDRVWEKLAVSLGSAGEPERALAAARRGLELVPRSEALLRVQALAVGQPGASAEPARRALEAYLAHRAPDLGPAARALCSDRSEQCALERSPIHVHLLRPAR